MNLMPPRPGDHAGKKLPSEFFNTMSPSATVEVRVIRVGNFRARHSVGHSQNCPFDPDAMVPLHASIDCWVPFQIS
jgi:hypothetical protein